ncbi:MAG: hypothetical protein LBL45_11910 [Treponema sp.]|nr:hypothetical protein [Treponema sp.]
MGRLEPEAARLPGTDEWKPLYGIANKRKKRGEAAVYDERGGGMAGMTETGFQRRAGSTNHVVWVDETLHPASISGSPRVNLWIKFSARRRGIKPFL